MFVVAIFKDMPIELYSKRWLICRCFKQRGKSPHLSGSLSLFFNHSLNSYFFRPYYTPGIVPRLCLEWCGTLVWPPALPDLCSRYCLKAGKNAIIMWSTALSNMCELCFHFILFHFNVEPLEPFRIKKIPPKTCLEFSK